MNIQLLMSGVMLVSVLTGLTVEVIKKLISEENKCYNLIALVTSCVLSIAIGVGYVMLNDMPFNSDIIITIIAMTFLAALASMLGFDKLKQALEQMKAGK